MINLTDDVLKFLGSLESKMRSTELKLSSNLSNIGKVATSVGNILINDIKEPAGTATEALEKMSAFNGIKNLEGFDIARNKLAELGYGGETVRTTIDSVYSAIASRSSEIGQSFQTIGSFSGKMSEIGKFFEGISKSITQFSSDTKESAEETTKDGKAAVESAEKKKTAFSSLSDVVKTVGERTKTTFSFFSENGLSGGFEEIGNKITGLLPSFDQLDFSAKNVFSKSTSTISGIVNQTTKSLLSVVGVALKLIAPGVLLGAVLVGLGLVQQEYGIQLEEFLQIAMIKGPEIIQALIDGALAILPEMIVLGTELMVGFLDVIAANLPTILEGGMALITTLLEGVAQSLPLIMEAAIPIIGALLEGIILGLPQLILSGFSLLRGLIDGIFQNMDLIVETVEKLIGTLTTAIEIKLPQIIQEGIAILLSLIEGISKSLPKLIPLVLSLFTTIVNALLSNLPKILEGGIRILSALIDGIVQFIPQLPGIISRIFTSLLTAIVANLPQILQKGVELLSKLGAGIIQAIPLLLSQIPQVFNRIKSSFSNFDWLSIGKNIIDGIGRGIRNFAGSIADAAKSAAKSAFNGAKKFLGINSPSRLFRDEIGKFIPKGIAVGIDQDGEEVQDSLDTLSAGLSFVPDIADGNYFRMLAGTPVGNVPQAEDKTTLLMENLLSSMRKLMGQDQTIVLQVDGQVLAKVTRDPLDRELGMKKRDKLQARGLR